MCQTRATPIRKDLARKEATIVPPHDSQHDSDADPDTTEKVRYVAGVGDSDDAETVGDEQLLEAVRAGDESSYGVLYERHRSTALNVARMHTRNLHDAEDLVSEAFAKILAVIRNGGGPQKFMRSYLVTTIGRLAVDHATASGRMRPVGEDDELDQSEDFDDVVVKQCESITVAAAYASLPERWQAVLWHTEVDGMKPQAVAGLLGMSPNAVSALSKRAREGLQSAYLQAQVSHTATDACPEIAGELGAFVRGSLGARARGQVQRHLDVCPRCTAEYLQLQDLGVGMRTWLLPALAALPLWGTESKVLAALMVSGAGGTATGGAAGVQVSATHTPDAAGAAVDPVFPVQGAETVAGAAAAQGVGTLAGGQSGASSGAGQGAGLGLKIAVGVVAASAAVALVGVGVNTLVKDDGANTSTTLGGLPFPADGDVTEQEPVDADAPTSADAADSSAPRRSGSGAGESGHAAPAERSRSPYSTVFDQPETSASDDPTIDPGQDNPQPPRSRGQRQSEPERDRQPQSPWSDDSARRQPAQRETPPTRGEPEPAQSPTPRQEPEQRPTPTRSPQPEPSPSPTPERPEPSPSPTSRPSEPSEPATPRPSAQPSPSQSPADSGAADEEDDDSEVVIPRQVPAPVPQVDPSPTVEPSVSPQPIPGPVEEQPEQVPTAEPTQPVSPEPQQPTVVPIPEPVFPSLDPSLIPGIDFEQPEDVDPGLVWQWPQD